MSPIKLELYILLLKIVIIFVFTFVQSKLRIATFAIRMYTVLKYQYHNRAPRYCSAQ